MAKDTSNKPFIPFRFNEQVNAILLIMFMTVAIILTIKGCGNCLLDKSQSTQESQTNKNTIVNDSIKSDSTITVL